MIFNRNVPTWPLYLAFNMSIILFVVYMGRMAVNPPGGFRKLIRRWYFLLLLLFIYQETGGLAFLYFPYWMDNGLASIEHSLFGVHPTIFLQKFNIPILNEYFMFGYFTYFFLILSYALILLYKKMYYEMDRYVTTVGLTFLICFFMFYFFPIAGPRFLFADIYDTGLKGYVFVPLVDYVIKNGAAEGGSMPSSHTAAAIVILVHAWRTIRPVGYIYAFVVLGLVIGTFWGRFHFITDTIVGFIIAVACIILVDRLTKTNYLSFFKLFKKDQTGLE